MFNLSAESFPDDSIVANLSINANLPVLQVSHPLETLELVQLSPVADETTTKNAENIPLAQEDPAADAIKLYTKSLTNGNRRVGGAFKRSALALSKKSASVDSLHSNSRNENTPMKNSGGSNLLSNTISKRSTYRGYDHVQSKVKVEIDNAKQQETKRRSKFQRHQSMPETLCPDPTSLVDLPQSQISNTELVKALREQLVAKDLLISQKNLLISQLNFLNESVEQESHDKLKLQRKIEAMRMEIMKVNAQNIQYQEELRQLTLKMESNSGSASAVSSSGSFPISGVHTNSSAGSSGRQYISYSSSSGVSSVSPAAFPSDDRFLVQRKPIKRTDSGCVLDRSLDGSHQFRQLERSTGDIVLFDKSHIDDCPIISSSSTLHEFFEDFQENSASNKATPNGSRKKRRKRFVANTLRKRLRRMAKYCTPCLKHNDDSDEYEYDTSLLYTGLNGDLACNSSYNSFK